MLQLSPKMNQHSFSGFKVGELVILGESHYDSSKSVRPTWNQATTDSPKLLVGLTKFSVPDLLKLESPFGLFLMIFPPS